MKTKLSDKYTIICLEPNTCMDRAVHHFIKKSFSKEPKIVYVKSFDDLISTAKKDKNNLIILPNINSLSIDLELDPNWKKHSENIFVLANPPLYLAKNNSNKNTKCVTINALEKLIKNENLKIVYGKTTQDCGKLVKENKCTYCVTNENGVKNNKLKIVKELKKIDVIWIPFSYIGK